MGILQWVNTSTQAQPCTHWRRPAASPELVWHSFAEDDWVVYEPGTGATHALGWLAATVLTLVEDGADSAESVAQALAASSVPADGGQRLEPLGKDDVLLALTQLHASGLIECV